MHTLRPAAERGHIDLGWLDTRHSFSFGDYYDPKHMGFRGLRVINDDRIAPGGGFPEHPHRDMEIVTYVLDGALEHRDSLGNGSVIRPGEVQRMSAGTGVRHSEYNHSGREAVRLLQIWIVPAERGIAPGYEQKRIPVADTPNEIRLVASPDGAEGSVRIHTDARVYAMRLDDGRSVRHELPTGRHGWIQVARGTALANGVDLAEGDGLALSDVDALEITGRGGAELLLFDLA